jgi:hypothetical protein
MTALASLVRSFAALLTPDPRNERLLKKWITAARYDHGLRDGGDLAGPRVLAVNAADDEPATVYVQQPGQRAGLVGGRVAAHRDRRSALRPGHDTVLHRERYW